MTNFLRRLMSTYGVPAVVIWCAAISMAISSGMYVASTMFFGIGTFQVVGVVRSIIISGVAPLIVLPLILGLLRDIQRGDREREQLHIRLQKAARMEALGTMAGGIAHDLNNILSGIIVYPDLLLLDLPPESPLRRDVEAIGAAGQRAAAVVQDLMTMARRGLPGSETFDLNDVVREYLESHEHRSVLAAHPRVRCTATTGTAPLWVAGSRIALFKALMNLVANAVEAIPGEGEVRISATRLPDATGGAGATPAEPATVELRIADNGAGIPAAHLDRIFEPFYTRKALGHSGTGLGLAVVWGVVHDHRGNIAVTSVVGAGTEFVLTFPLVEKSPDRQPGVELAVQRGRGERVLVVDDIVEQRMVTCRMLESLGYQASAVASGEEAIDLLLALPSDRLRPDLLLLDLVMDPGISGLETFRRIQEFIPDQRAIFASGYAPPDLVRCVADLGAAAFLRKPYRLEELAAALRVGLGQGDT